MFVHLGENLRKFILSKYDVNLPVFAKKESEIAIPHIFCGFDGLHGNEWTPTEEIYVTELRNFNRGNGMHLKIYHFCFVDDYTRNVVWWDLNMENIEPGDISEVKEIFNPYKLEDVRLHERISNFVFCKINGEMLYWH